MKRSGQILWPLTSKPLSPWRISVMTPTEIWITNALYAEVHFSNKQFTGEKASRGVEEARLSLKIFHNLSTIWYAGRPYLDQPHVLVDGLLLSREALLQLVGEARPAAVDGILAAVFWRSQNHLVVRILERLPLQLSVCHLVQHAAERLMVQQVTDVVDSWETETENMWTQQGYITCWKGWNDTQRHLDI